MPGPIVAAIDGGLLGFAIVVALMLFIVGKLVLLMRATPHGRKAMRGPTLLSQALRHWRQGNDR